MTRPTWTIDATKKTAHLDYLGGALEVTCRDDGKLFATWIGPAEAETKSHARAPLDAAILAAEARIEAREPLDSPAAERDAQEREQGHLAELQQRRGAVDAGPDVIRKPTDELRIALHIHHRASVIEALNALPGEIADSLRQTHPGFFSRIRTSDRPHPLDEDGPEPWSIPA